MSRLRLSGIPLLFVFLAGCSFQLTFPSAPSFSVVSSNVASNQKYHVIVTFSNEVSLIADTHIGEAFNRTITQGTGESYTVGGMLLPLEGQSIPLILTISQNTFDSGQASVLAGTSKSNLIPNQPLVVAGTPGYTVNLVPVN